MKILIVGGGIAGLTTALCCARSGFDVSVFEQAPEFSEVGAGLQLSPNGTKILYDMGLGPKLEEVAFKPRSLDLRLGRNGMKLFSIPLSHSEEKYGGPYLHIHRADLVSILANAVSYEKNCTVFTNEHVAEVRSLNNQAKITLSQGKTFTGDLVIGADGIHSVVRKQIIGDDAPRFTGNIAWRATIPADKIPHDLISPTATVWTGPKKHAVTYYIKNRELVNFVGIVEQDNWHKESWTESGVVSELRSEFSSFSEEIQLLLEQAETCFKWALYDRLPLKTWFEERMVILGDAAHPMLPFQAQGAVMAIEDAAVLSNCLSKQESQIEQAIIDFEKQRKPRTSKVQESARSNMKLFHHGSISSEVLNYGPIWLAAKLVPNFINSRQDWLYSYNIENAN